MGIFQSWRFRAWGKKMMEDLHDLQLHECVHPYLVHLRVLMRVFRVNFMVTPRYSTATATSTNTSSTAAAATYTLPRTTEQKNQSNVHATGQTQKPTQFLPQEGLPC